MSNSGNNNRPIPRLPRGFSDTFATNVLTKQHMINIIRNVYELYGFAPLETPSIEYLDALGKYLPESDIPAGGVFAFRDDDNNWIALRYDLTAPLSRVFSEHKNSIPIPFRRYQVGLVWRNEKPGPGRFREFYQFDIDSVGTSSMMADTEVCCVLADTMEALHITRGDYVVRVNNRKALNGVLEVIGVSLSDEKTCLTILRAIDKLDRLGIDGVKQLLGKGRTDESGDFTDGAHLEDNQIQKIIDLLSVKEPLRSEVCNKFENIIQGSTIGQEGVTELREIDNFLLQAGYSEDRVVFDPTVVRGLAYYTGPVFEVSLTFEVIDETGQKHQFGSVAGGGRYDYLVERFIGEKVPATGASIGVDRLLAALAQLGQLKSLDTIPPVIITVMDKKHLSDYQKMAFELRRSNIPSEVYLGSAGFKKQLQYADQRGSVVAVIAGSQEFETKQISLKDLRLGRELSKDISQRETWIKERPAQVTIPSENLVKEVREILSRYDLAK